MRKEHKVTVRKVEEVDKYVAELKTQGIEFRPIPMAGLEHYIVSNYHGIIINTITKRIMSNAVGSVGYRQTCLRTSDKPSLGITKQTAYFVARAWCPGYNKNDRKELSHCGDKGRWPDELDNDLDLNYEFLTWSTHKENCNQSSSLRAHQARMNRLYSNPEWRQMMREKKAAGVRRHWAKVKEERALAAQTITEE